MVNFPKVRNKVFISVDLGHFSRAPLRLTKIKLNIKNLMQRRSRQKVDVAQNYLC